MFKKILCILVAMLTVTCFCACFVEGEEIVRENFDINNNNLLADGFSDFQNRLNGIYDEPNDLVQMGGQNTIPVVDFDDTVCVSMNGYDFYTRFMYYTLVQIKSSDISNSMANGVNAKDEPSFWNSFAIDSYEIRSDWIYESAKKYAYYVVISNAIMNEYGFTESNTYALSYDNILNLLGSEQAIRDHYCAYGVGDDYLLPYLKMYCAYNEFREYMVGVDGKYYPTQEQAKQFFYDECIFLEQIVFSYVEPDENGYTYKKSDADIADAKSRGEAIYASIKEDPRMFDRNMHLTELPDFSENVHGYTYIPNEIISELEEAYFKLKPGEVVAVDTPLGYYILRALEKTDRAYENSESRIIDAYCQQAFDNIMNKYMDKLVIDESQLNRYSFDDVVVLKNN